MRAASGTTDRRVMLFLAGVSTDTCSMYVPGQTLIVSPTIAEFTAD